MSQPQVSRHLAYLRSAGWVTEQRDGNQIFNRLISPENGTQRVLILLLESVFGLEETFWRDLMTLREAIKGGICQIRQAKPFPRIIAPKLSFASSLQQLSSEFKEDCHERTSTMLRQVVSVD